MTSVHLKTITQTKSITYVTTEILRSFQSVVVSLGLDPDYLLVHHQETLNHGISTWLTEGTLDSIHLEIWDSLNPDNLIARIDLSFFYYHEEPADDFYSDMDSIKNIAKKITGVKRGHEYRVRVKTKDGATKLSGWSSSSYKSTDGLNHHAIGASIDSPHIRGSLSVWHK